MRSARGVTLIEMLIVLVIIGLVATLTTVAVFHILIKSKQDAARAQMSQLATGVKTFKLEQDRYPAALADLEAPPTGLRRPFPQGGYLESKGVPVDPWGRPYVYEAGGEEGFTIQCLGEDGVIGGTGANQDFSTADPVDR